MMREKMFGSNDGELPMARISPFSTSITTNAASAPAMRRLARLLHVEVDAEPELPALHRLLDGRLALEVAERVDHHPGRPVLAAEEAVVGVLDARLTDPVTELDAGVALVLIELLLGHLAHGPEQVRAELRVRIGAEEDAFDRDAGELLLVLEDVLDHR